MELGGLESDVDAWLDEVLGTNWKTITGGFLMMGSVVLEVLGMAVSASVLMNLGMGLGVIGVGHKLQRMD